HSNTWTFGFSLSRLANTQPADPAPTTTKSYRSSTAVPDFNRERSYLTNDNSIPLCGPDWLSGCDMAQSRDGGREEVPATRGSHPFFKTNLHVVRLIRQDGLD